MPLNWNRLRLVIRPLAVLANVVLVAIGIPGRGFAANEFVTPASQEWTMVGGDLYNTRYSMLDQISRLNISRVRGAWISDKFDEGGASRATPVVAGGLMFVTAGRYVYALNAKTGTRIWRYRTVPDRDEKRSVPASAGRMGMPNARGVSSGGGMVFIGLMDGRVIALTQKSGKLVWSRQTGVDQPRVGQWASSAPTYTNGVVFVGLSNGDYSLRGRFTALDANSGKVIWQKFSIPGPGEPGHETWPTFNDTWKTGGGGVWTNSPVDPSLSLVYFATGNAVPPFAGDWRPGDNLYTCSVLAVDIRTGKLRWYYQLVHHDVFEADIGTPMILYDTEVGEQRHKALAVMRADGYLFQLDRETGKPMLSVEERLVPQLASQRTSATQPFPVGGDSILMSCDDWRKQGIPAGFVLRCSAFTPSSSPPPSTDPPNVLAPFPNVRVFPMAYSPQTGYFYAQSRSWLRWARRAHDPYYLDWSEMVPGLKEYGTLAAIDGRTGKIAWKKSIPTTSLGGAPLVTAAGLMFRSSGEGNVEAYDAATGELLWQFQTGMAGAEGPPATYEIDGEQYLAVSMGRAIWAFKLGGTIPPVRNPPARDEEADPFSGPIVDTTEIETTSLGHTNIEPGKRYFIDEYTFNPYRTRVQVGTQVLFVNNGNVRHEIVALDGSWGTGPLNPSEQIWITFNNPGKYAYFCKEHPWSYGEVIVSAAGASQGEAREGPGGTRSRPRDFLAQAIKGKEQYDRNCSTCHGEKLGGHSPAPALMGNTFASHWENASAGELLDRIRSTMPQGKAGSLARDTYLSIVAYILQVNGISVGKAPLDGNLPEALKRVKLRRVGDRL